MFIQVYNVLRKRSQVTLISGTWLPYLSWIINEEYQNKIIKKKKSIAKKKVNIAGDYSRHIEFFNSRKIIYQNLWALRLQNLVYT